MGLRERDKLALPFFHFNNQKRTISKWLRPMPYVLRYRAHAARGRALLDGFALSRPQSLRSFAAA
jgi:hypothetical protein